MFVFPKQTRNNTLGNRSFLILFSVGAYFYITSEKIQQEISWSVWRKQDILA